MCIFNIIRLFNDIKLFIQVSYNVRCKVCHIVNKSLAVRFNLHANVQIKTIYIQSKTMARRNRGSHNRDFKSVINKGHINVNSVRYNNDLEKIFICVRARYIQNLFV